MFFLLTRFGSEAAPSLAERLVADEPDVLSCVGKNG